MASFVRKTLGLLPFLAILLSCDSSMPAVRVLWGNMAYGSGLYQKAILNYLAADDGLNVGVEAVHFNLGNVYFALGEGDAALGAWQQAEENTEDIDVLFRIAFNRGVLYYHWGRYDEAYRSFRRALSLDPTDIDAKINLEDALSRIRTELPSSPEEGVSGIESIDEGGDRLLDYVRRKEAGAWTSAESPDTAHTRDW
ncbi:MAG: tetratricopeptide repeat protein [Spirochaetales bacterium]|nr:tetratricopeptide repeat protein [Spirochaetales bacterium]